MVDTLIGTSKRETMNTTTRMIMMGLSLCCLAGCGERELSTDKSASEESPIVKAIL